MMLVCSDFSIKFPYNIQKKEGPEEFESRNLEEPYCTEGEKNTKYGSTSNSPKDCLFSFCTFKILCRHPDEDSIVSTHDEVDEDDVEEGKSSCRSKNMSKI
jgi:hypothetical protein